MVLARLVKSAHAQVKVLQQNVSEKAFGKKKMDARQKRKLIHLNLTQSLIKIKMVNARPTKFTSRTRNAKHVRQVKNLMVSKRTVLKRKPLQNLLLQNLLFQKLQIQL